MNNKYNMKKRSDMRRFHRDMMKKIEVIAEEKARSIYEEDCTQNINFYGMVFSRSNVECPNCHNKVPATIGYSICPVCRGTICVTSETIRFG